MILFVQRVGDHHVNSASFGIKEFQIDLERKEHGANGAIRYSDWLALEGLDAHFLADVQIGVDKQENRIFHMLHVVVLMNEERRFSDLSAGCIPTNRTKVSVDLEKIEQFILWSEDKKEPTL